MTVKVTSYRLRGGQIQPKISCVGGTPTSEIASFFTQTFGAEKMVSDINDAKTTLLASTDFQGQKPPTNSLLGIQNPAYIATTFSRASYQGRPLRTTDGALVFSATEEHVSAFIDESEIGTA